ncbi:retrovirus-related pol polyprotein from transposon TNT 1-94 [Tanacetum coccineum]
MTTLAEFMIIADADNRPPILEKSLYDSWKSRMELYIENRENGRMILNSVQNGPLVWPTIVEEDGTTRTKRYEELSVAKKLQAYCDLKATYIVLQGLPPDVYAIDCDPSIACLNKAMAFLTAVASSRFPSTNNQLRTSSNPRNQATIQDDRVTVQQVQGRQGQSYAGTGYKGNATSSGGNNAGGQARVVKCYNCQGEGHMARQCTQPKRPRNAAWFKEKAMLAEAQESGQILDEEQLAFLADPGIPDGQAAQTTIPNTAAFQTEDLDAYDSDYVISEVPHFEPYHTDMDNQSVHAMQGFEQTPVVDFIDNEITSDSNIIPYSQYLQETQQAAVQDTNLYAQQDSMILSVIEQMSEQMINHRLVLKSIPLKKAQRIKPTLYDGSVISSQHAACPVIDDEETLILKELNRLSEDFFHNKNCLMNKLSGYKLHTLILTNLLRHLSKVEAPKELLRSLNRAMYAKLLSKNKRLHKEIEHLKKIYKDQFDSIKKTRALSKEHCDSLIAQLNSKSMENADLKGQIQEKVFVTTTLQNELRKLKGKNVLDNAATITNATTIAPGMFKLDLDPLAPRLLKNRDAHIDYLKYTQEQADILLFGNRLKSSTSASRSQPTGNKKNDRISQTPSSNMKNKVSNVSLSYLDSGCSKHTTGNRSQLMNFVSKFLGTVLFENDQIAKIIGYGDYQLGNVIISMNLEGVDLLSRSRDTNLYTISLDDMLKTSPICLLSKALKTKSWLWHRQLSHLNFDTLNKLAKDGLARGILKLKFKKDHLCSACALGKSKKFSHQPKAEDTNQEKLYLLNVINSSKNFMKKLAARIKHLSLYF